MALQEKRHFANPEQDYHDYHDLPGLGFWCAGHRFGTPRGIPPIKTYNLAKSCKSCKSCSIL